MAKRIVQSFSVESITVPIGTIIFSPNGTVPTGFLACEGGTFDSAVYNNLYLFLGTNVLPDFRNRVPRGVGALTGSAGDVQEDALQNITGTIGPIAETFANSSGQVETGALYHANNAYSGTLTPTSSDTSPSGVLGFDASRIARTATETRVKSYIGKFVIKAFDVVVNQGEIDVSAVATSVQALKDTTLLPFRNKIINGDFEIWQRGTTFNSPGFGFLADRWLLAFDGSGATRTITRQNHILGQTNVPGNPKYFLRWAQTVAGSGGTYNALTQRIESVSTLSGKNITVTLYMKADTATTINQILLRQNFGTGGSPSSLVDTPLGGAISVGTSWTKIQFYTSLPSIAGKTLGSNNNDFLELQFLLKTNTVQTIDISHISVVEGDARADTDPFSPRYIQQELVLCQRYYTKSYDIETAPGTATTLGMVCSGLAVSGIGNPPCVVYFPTKMRAAPTLLGWDGAGTANRCSYVDAGAGTTFTHGQTLQTAAYNISTSSFSIKVNGSSGQNCYIHYTADAEL